MSSSSRQRGKAECEAAGAPPPDLDQIRRELARKLATLLDRQQSDTCPEPACRRHRRCAAPNFICSNRRRPAAASPEQETAALARLQRDLRRRLAASAGEAE